MGEVYKAKDTRLDRVVAVKVLPEHLADNIELRQRFEREARAVSSLNHPHICTLFDVGEQDGVDYLVMEYIEGETLAERLKKGALSLDETLRYSIEMADALDKAHRQGVVHRDIKPGNIMLTISGVKLLDFGLAIRLHQGGGEASADADSNLLTRQKSLTAEGAIIGTFQYMAPEQLEGGDVDARTDLFAFGAVIYEMATGRKAFEGKSQASLITSIMSSQPPSIATHQKMTPPAFDHVVRTCLAKDPNERRQTAHDVLLDLQWIAEQGARAESTSDASVSRAAGVPVRWTVLAVVAAMLAAAIVGWTVARPPPPVTTRLSVTLPLADRLEPTGLAVSPDGRTLVYVATRDGVTQLYRRALDALEAAPMRGTDNATYPFFSPDGEWVGFFADGKLRKVRLGGATAVTLCDAPSGRGGSWASNDTIYFTPISAGAVFAVSASGGVPWSVAEVGVGDQWRWPDVLPGGRGLLWNDIFPGGVGVQALEASEIRPLLERASFARYLPTGHVVFVRDQSLWSVPFDADRLELAGAPTPLVEGIRVDALGFAFYAVSDAGTLVYVSSSQQENELVWRDRDGNEMGTIGEPGVFRNPVLSPDGERVAVSRTDMDTGNDDIWVLDERREASSRYTFDPASELSMAWSPDGSRIAFNSNRGDGTYKLYEAPAGGVGEPQFLLGSDTNVGLLDWSSDGRFILYFDGGLNRTVRVLPMDGPGDGEAESFALRETDFDQYQAKLSPDGRWLAYVSNESGASEVYVLDFPDAEGKWQISNEGGVQPQWSGTGFEIFYIALDARLMAVDVSGESELEVGIPHALFQTQIWRGASVEPGIRAQYDVSADGERFLINRAHRGAAGTEIHVVLDWFSELESD